MVYSHPNLSGHELNGSLNLLIIMFCSQNDFRCMNHIFFYSVKAAIINAKNMAWPMAADNNNESLMAAVDIPIQLYFTLGVSQCQGRILQSLYFKDATSSNPAEGLFQCTGSLEFYRGLSL